MSCGLPFVSLGLEETVWLRVPKFAFHCLRTEGIAEGAKAFQAETYGSVFLRVPVYGVLMGNHEDTISEHLSFGRSQLDSGSWASAFSTLVLSFSSDAHSFHTHTRQHSSVS